MGFSYRKSVNIELFRVNLSKSGFVFSVSNFKHYPIYEYHRL